MVLFLSIYVKFKAPYFSIFHSSYRYLVLPLKMCRKIKGKKHHGTKDPEKQQQKRLDLIKAKVSACGSGIYSDLKLFFGSGSLIT